MKLNLLTFNCHKFRSPIKRTYNLEYLREMLSTIDVDIVMLQELRGVHPQKIAGQYTMEPLEFLADQLWDHYAYGKNSVYPKGHHGNGILSKYPIQAYDNHDISVQPLQKRGLLRAQVLVPDKFEFSIYSTHLDLNQYGRKRQVKQILEIIAKDTHPFLIGGDFNDWNSFVHRQLIQQLEAGPRVPTFPSFMPTLCLDSIYASKFTINNVKRISSAQWRKLSDHLPLLAEVELNLTP